MHKSQSDGGLGFLKIRPVMVPLNYSDRTIVAQGLVNNTLGVMQNRLSQNVGSDKFAYPDYIFRTNGKHSHTVSRLFDGQYAHGDIIKLNNKQHPNDTSSAPYPNKYIEVMANCDSVDYHDIYDGITDYDKNILFVDKNLVNF
jgi:hypothetical protein